MDLVMKYPLAIAYMHTLIQSVFQIASCRITSFPISCL